MEILQPLRDADKIQRLEPFGEDAGNLLNLIQESFGIEFSVDELIAAQTIGQLSDCLSNKLAHPRSERCLNAVVFYRLRRAFLARSGGARATVFPRARMTELLPWAQRRNRWRELSSSSGMVLPNLAYPLWLVFLSLLVSFGIAWAFSHRFPQFSAGGLVTFGVGLSAWILLNWVLHPLARAFPESCDTFADLVKVTLARNYAKLAGEFGGSPRKEILSVLSQLIAVEIGCGAEKVTAETPFPEGLGIY